MSRSIKARQTLAAATRAPVELTTLRKMIRLPVADAMPHLTGGPAAIRLPLDVVSLEYRYYPKHTSMGSKWVPNEDVWMWANPTGSSWATTHRK